MFLTALFLLLVVNNLPTMSYVTQNEPSCPLLKMPVSEDVAEVKCTLESTENQNQLAKSLKESAESNEKMSCSSQKMNLLNTGKMAMMGIKNDVVTDFGNFFPIPSITFQSGKQKGQVNSNTNVYEMCEENVYMVEFDPYFYYPSNHLHVTCYTGDSSSPDYNCLSGEGVCIKKVLYKTIKYNHLGVADINQWADIVIPFTVACSCNVRSGSFFTTFV